METSHHAEQATAVNDKQLCIHFVNSVVWRASEHPADHITGPDVLMRFARRAGVLNEEQVEHLRQHAADNPEEAQAALERAKDVREAIYRVLYAVANHLPADPSDVEMLNDMVTEAHDQLHLVPGEIGSAFEWRWKSAEPQFDMLLWSVARSAAELLTSDELKKLKTCPGEGCAFLFLDRSRNGKRRWCEMDLCGNRNKVKRFRQGRQVK